MSLQSRISTLITAIGVDIKKIQQVRPIQRYISGRYYALDTGSLVSGGIPTEGELGLAPIIISETVTFNQLAFFAIDSGVSPASIRMVIYDDTGLIEPKNLVFDSGQIATTPGSGIKTWSGSLTLQPGVYWIGGVVQGGASTRPTVRQVSTNGSGLITGTDSIGQTAIHGWAFTSGVSGAPPSTWVRGSNTTVADVLRIWARVA